MATKKSSRGPRTKGVWVVVYEFGGECLATGSKSKRSVNRAAKVRRADRLYRNVTGPIFIPFTLEGKRHG